MTGWVRAGEAAVRLGITRRELFLRLDALGVPVRLDRELHAVVVPLDAVDRLAAELLPGAPSMTTWRAASDAEGC